MQQTFSSQTQESLCLQYYMVNGNNQWQQCTVYNSFAIPFGVLYMLNMKEWYSFMLHTHVVYTVVYCYWYLQLTVIYNIQLISRVVYMLRHETIIVPCIAYNIFY